MASTNTLNRNKYACKPRMREVTDGLCNMNDVVGLMQEGEFVLGELTDIYIDEDENTLSMYTFTLLEGGKKVEMFFDSGDRVMILYKHTTEDDEEIYLNDIRINTNASDDVIERYINATTLYVSRGDIEDEDFVEVETMEEVEDEDKEGFYECEADDGMNYTTDTFYVKFGKRVPKTNDDESSEDESESSDDDEEEEDDDILEVTGAAALKYTDEEDREVIEGVKKFGKKWKTIYENSPLLQKRYSKSNAKNKVKAGSAGVKRRALILIGLGLVTNPEDELDYGDPKSRGVKHRYPKTDRGGPTTIYYCRENHCGSGASGGKEGFCDMHYKQYRKQQEKAKLLAKEKDDDDESSSISISSSSSSEKKKAPSKKKKASSSRKAASTTTKKKAAAPTKKMSMPHNNDDGKERTKSKRNKRKETSSTSSTKNIDPSSDGPSKTKKQRGDVGGPTSGAPRTISPYLPNNQHNSSLSVKRGYVPPNPGRFKYVKVTESDTHREFWLNMSTKEPHPGTLTPDEARELLPPEDNDKVDCGRDEQHNGGKPTETQEGGIFSMLGISKLTSLFASKNQAEDKAKPEPEKAMAKEDDASQLMVTDPSIDRFAKAIEADDITTEEIVHQLGLLSKSVAAVKNKNSALQSQVKVLTKEKEDMAKEKARVEEELEELKKKNKAARCEMDFGFGNSAAFAA